MKDEDILGCSFDKFLEKDHVLPEMLRCAASWTGSEERAWDIVQDACIKLGANWTTVQSHRYPVRYVIRTIKNLVIDSSEKARRRDDFDRNQALPLQESIESQVEGKILLERIFELADPEHWELIAYRYRGYEYEEIAQRLGIKISTLKSRMRRIRLNLFKE
jgi:RNA polymerase sigma factor (sigma-70 family)